MKIQNTRRPDDDEVTLIDQIKQYAIALVIVTAILYVVGFGGVELEETLSSLENDIPVLSVVRNYLHQEFYTYYDRAYMMSKLEGVFPAYSIAERSTIWFLISAALKQINKRSI